MLPATDGDGWVECALGHRHWGRHGAAGLLVYRDVIGRPGHFEVLLQHRAEWSHHGGTWGVLGGARHSSERPRDAALREAHEEADLSGDFILEGQHDDEHGGWTYSTLLARGSGELVAAASGGESLDVAWWPADAIPALPLHPGFAQTWPLLHAALAPWHIVVDAANVIGARPDGWWRDRAAAARRLAARCARLAESGISRGHVLDGWPDDVLTHRWPRWTLVVEGSARSAASHGFEGIRVVEAPGSGDDTIVDEVRALDAATLVVSADRELRERVRAAGAATTGPRWLLALLKRYPAEVD